MANTIAEKVQAITGVATADTELIDMGKKFVINNVPKHALLGEGTDGSNIVNSSGQAVPDVILNVRRNGRICRPVPENMAYAFDLKRTYTITVDDYSTIVAAETITVDEITLTARASGTTEELDFVPETSNDATAQNIADALANLTHLTVSVATNVVTVTGAKSCSESMTGVSVATTSSTTSLFDATALFPAYYIQAATIYIKPDPTASAVGVVTKVDYSDIADDSEFDNIIVNYAAAMEFQKLAELRRDAAISAIDKITNGTTGTVKLFLDTLAAISWTAPTDPTLTKSLPTPSFPTALAISWSDVTDPAMTKALPSVAITTTLDLSAYTTRLQAALDSLIQYVGRDGDATTQTIETKAVHSAGYWIYDEDAEMVRANIETAQAEIANAQAEIGHMQALVAKYGQNVQAEVADVKGEIEVYLAELQQEIGIHKAQLDEQVAQYQAESMELKANVEREAMRVKAELDTYLAEVQFEIQNYRAQVEEESARVQALIAEARGYVEASQGVAAAVQGEIALMTQDLQRSRTHYEWAVAEVSRFAPPAPQPPQERERRRR